MKVKAKGPPSNLPHLPSVVLCGLPQPLALVSIQLADPHQPTTGASPGISPKKPATFHPPVCLASGLSLSSPPLD